jgi:CheY-like chemotaxis protein
MQLHILLLDDEASVLFALKLLLQALGFKVTDFSDPSKALACVADPSQSRELDVIISDLRMPGMNGIEVLKQVQQLRPELPFLLMSAHAQQEDIERAKALGAIGFLAKPFSPEELTGALRGLAKRSAA